MINVKSKKARVFMILFTAVSIYGFYYKHIRSPDLVKQIIKDINQLSENVHNKFYKKGLILIIRINPFFVIKISLYIFLHLTDAIFRNK